MNRSQNIFFLPRYKVSGNSFFSLLISIICVHNNVPQPKHMVSNHWGQLCKLPKEFLVKLRMGREVIQEGSQQRHSLPSVVRKMYDCFSWTGSQQNLWNGVFCRTACDVCCWPWGQGRSDFFGGFISFLKSALSLKPSGAPTRASKSSWTRLQDPSWPSP